MSQELRETRQQCTALREQLQGLLVVTASAGQVDDNETEEKLKAAEAEKQALVDEQNKMKEEFEKWKEQYRQEHEGEEPSEDDRLVLVDVTTAILFVIFHSLFLNFEHDPTIRCLAFIVNDICGAVT